MFADVIGGLAIGIVVVLGALILGFCGYEISWKQRRLRADLAALQALNRNLSAVARELISTRARLAERAGR